MSQKHRFNNQNTNLSDNSCSNYQTKYCLLLYKSGMKLQKIVTHFTTEMRFKLSLACTIYRDILIIINKSDKIKKNV